MWSPGAPRLQQLAAVVAVLLASFCQLSVAQDASAIRRYDTQFTHLPNRFFFFKDSTNVLLHESIADDVWRSMDSGASWSKAVTIPAAATKAIIQHPYSPRQAFAITAGTTHYKTDDAGATWSAITTPVAPASASVGTLSFHSQRAGYLIYLGTQCTEAKICFTAAYYSKDAGASWQLLNTYVKQCVWGAATEQIKSLPEDAVYCTEWPSKSGAERLKLSSNLMLVYSDSYFSSRRTVTFDRGQTRGVVGFGAVNKFLVAAIKPLATSDGTVQDLDLYVSIDGFTFANAQFPAGANLKENAYTVLESSNSGLVIDVDDGSNMGSGKELGTLYFSNSNGTYFTKSLSNTNRNAFGNVDFEKVQGVEGIVLVNIVSNPDQLVSVPGTFGQPKRLESRISFNDGGDWGYIPPPALDVGGSKFPCASAAESTATKVPNEKCALHLHSISSQTNVGYIYSSAGAPGILVGVGNVGDYLNDYEDCSTFISTDGGISWRMSLQGAHKYELGDMGGFIVAIPDNKVTDKIRYSYDFGKTWGDYSLGVSVKAKSLTTDPYSTTSRFLLVSSEQQGAVYMYHISQLDFSSFFSRTCDWNAGSPASSADFEVWKARSINFDIECLLGHSQEFYRRKETARCKVGKDFAQLPAITKNCQCSMENFECDFDFVHPTTGEAGQCVPASADSALTRGIPECRAVGDKYWASSGYRKIPGDTCEGGLAKDRRIEATCTASNIMVNTQLVKKSVTSFNYHISSHYSINNSAVILLRDTHGGLWRSEDEGGRFSQISLPGKGVTGDGYEVLAVRLHDHVDGRVFVFTSDNKMFYSGNFGKDWQAITVPAAPNGLGLDLLDFHPQQPDWLLFVGSTQCPACYSMAYYSSDNGRTWDKPFDTYVNKCVFAVDSQFVQVEQDAIFCSAYHQKTGSQDAWSGSSTTGTGNVMTLYKYPKFGRVFPIKLVERVVQYYVFENYMAAAVEGIAQVDLLVSMDGTKFVPAQFPPRMDIRKNAFTILQSSTGSIFLDVFQSTVYGKEYGTLFTSNANGTFFSLSLLNTNRNDRGFVDFEKAQNVEGTILVNQVMNVTNLSIQSDPKKVVTKISFNDGGTYRRLNPPAGTICPATPGGTVAGTPCYLNLHSRTTMPVTGPIFSTKTAPGTMMGVGSVGAYLLDYTECDTFLTRDAGRTWKKIRDGAHRFEFGDSGALLVLVDDEVPTNFVLFSIDDGNSWQNYTFYEQQVRVTELTIEPSATSRKFLLIGTVVSVGGIIQQQSSMVEVAIQLDFSDIIPKQCEFRADGSGDYESWMPTNGKQVACVLGHQTQYWRRKAGRQCYIGQNADAAVRAPVQQDCDCTEEDFECDVGYWRNSNEKCVLFGAMDPEAPTGCVKGDKYTGSAGYRRLSKTTCKNGVNLEARVEKTCTGVVPTPVGPSEGGETVPVAGNTDSSSITSFDSGLDTVLYFTNSTTVVARTKNNKIWRSLESGRNWQGVGNDITNTTSVVMQNPYFPERVYFLSPWRRHVSTLDKGTTFQLFTTPDAPNALGAPILEFHAEEADWMIFIGDDGCAVNGNCRTTAYWTKDGGASWSKMTTYVRDCEWGRDALFKEAQRSLVLCSGYAEKSGSMKFKQDPLHLYRSTDLFASEPQMVFENIVGFAVSETYLVVAAQGHDTAQGQDMHLHVSVDGKKFAEAVFPPNVHVQRNGYTVLESDTGTLMLDVLTNSITGHQWGTLFISNSNGTFYTESLPNTNRNNAGYVDFEKLVGVEGAAVMNQVSNPSEVALGSDKHLRTVITYNDGGAWNLLPAPTVDTQGQRYPICDSDPSACHLHLHGFTEKAFIRNELSDAGATGMMIGLGNVGAWLDTMDRGNMYLTRDAGVTWREVAQGPHLFEYGDHGGIIVMARARTAVDSILFSLNSGLTFDTYSLGLEVGKKLVPERFITEPDSTSLRFVLLGRIDQTSVAVALNFENQLKRPCVNDTASDSQSDFELWQMRSGADSCALGHITRYYRRKQESVCFIGDAHAALPRVVENCKCMQSDFECSPGYYRDTKDNTCKLMEGYTESNTWGECVDGVQALSGAYRKLAKTTCMGGLALDSQQTRRCGSGSMALTLTLVLVPCALLLAGLGWYSYRKNSGGHIRLGDSVEPWMPGRMMTSASDGLKKFVPTRVSAFFSGLRRSSAPEYLPVNAVEETSDVLMDDYA